MGSVVCHMDFRLLGPLEVVENGAAIDVGSAKQRALLAVLLLNANRVVSTDVLKESLWGERPPEPRQRHCRCTSPSSGKAVGRTGSSPDHRGTSSAIAAGELDVDRVEQHDPGRRFGPRWIFGAGGRSRTSRTRASRSPRSPDSTSSASPAWSGASMWISPEAGMRRLSVSSKGSSVCTLCARGSGLSSCSRSTGRVGKPTHWTFTRRGEAALRRARARAGCRAEGAPASDSRA